MTVVVSRFESFPLEYQYCQGACGRELKNDPWILLPIDEPRTSSGTANVHTRTTLAELDLFTEFYIVYGELNAVRNTRHLVNTRLDAIEANERELRNRYQQRLQNKVDAIKERFSDLTERMSECDAPSDSQRSRP